MKRVFIVWLLALALTSCTGEIPTLTPTRLLSGPTVGTSPQPFLGPPTEVPPEMSGDIGDVDVTAAALPRDSVLPPLAIGTPSSRQTVEITAEDGMLLYGEMLQVAGDQRMPGVLLLSTDASAWGSFPEQLNAAGFTVLAMEIRAGGGVEDFRVMIEALTSGTADPARIGTVGAAAGADLALLGCSADEVCDGAALLSPLDQTTLPGAMNRYNPRPLYQAVSIEDEESYTTAEAIENAASGETLFQPLENAGRGTAILLNRADVADQLVTWLQRNIASQ